MLSDLVLHRHVLCVKPGFKCLHVFIVSLLYLFELLLVSANDFLHMKDVLFV